MLASKSCEIFSLLRLNHRENYLKITLYSASLRIVKLWTKMCKKPKSSISTKIISFPELSNEKKKSKDEEPLHKYFNAHQCHRPSEYLDAFEMNYSGIRKFFLNLTTVLMGDIRAESLFRSYAALRAEKVRQYKYYPLSIHPFSKLRIWSEGFILFGMLASNTAMAAHFSESESYIKNQDRYFLIIMYALDFIYVMNIVFNFFTGYVEGNTRQYIVLDLKKIAFNYAKIWLILDVLSSLSLVSGFIGTDNVNPHLILVSMKVLRLPILMLYLSNVLTVLRIGLTVKTLVEIVVLIVTYLTWNIFLQFGVEYIREGSFNPTNPSKCSWITRAKIWNSSLPIRFTFSLDRAVGMLRKNPYINVIKGDEGCFENFFVTAWLIAKLLVYHSTLKYIISLFGRESAKAKYFIMTKQVETLMNQRKFPPRIKKKILKFYAIRFRSSFSRNVLGDCLYFIERGTVAIYSESGCEICHLEDGDYFGAITLVSKHRLRTASVVAVTNCELFRLDREDFGSIIAVYPTVLETIKKEAVKRYERTRLLDEHHKAELVMEGEHIKKGFNDLLLADNIADK